MENTNTIVPINSAPPATTEIHDDAAFSRPPKRYRHPLISIAVIGLSLYMMYFVRNDFAYYFSSKTPVKVGDAPDALNKGLLKANSYVTVNGVPDRKHALLLQGKLSGFDSFTRLLQTDSQVFVQLHREQRTTDRVIPASFTGRVVEFGSLSYASLVQDYLAKHMSSSHDIPFEELKVALQQGRPYARDASGTRVQLQPDASLWINVAYPNEWTLQASKRKYLFENDAIEAVHKAFQAIKKDDLAAKEIRIGKDADPARMFWKFVMLIHPSDVTTVIKAIGNVDNQHIGLVRRQHSYSALRKDITTDDQSLYIARPLKSWPTQYEADSRPQPLITTVNNGKIEGRYGDSGVIVKWGLKPMWIPYSKFSIHKPAIEAITVASHLKVPATAKVIIDGAKPADYWYYPPLYLLLLTFIGFNAFLLRRWYVARKS